MRLGKMMMGRLRDEVDETGETGGGETTSDSQPWYASAGLSEDTLKDEKFASHLRRYDGIEAALKGGFETKQKLSQKQEGMLRLPGEDATDEERANFYNSIGRPEAPDKYSWQPEEGLDLDKELFGERMAKLHEAGLTDQQHSQVMSMYADEIKRMNEDYDNHQAKIANETEATLKKEWGKDYDANIEAAKSAVSPEFLAILKETGVINHYKVLKELRDIALSKREGGIDRNSGSGLTPAEELEQIKQNPAWNNKALDGHKELVKRAVELRAML